MVQDKQIFKQSTAPYLHYNMYSKYFRYYLSVLKYVPFAVTQSERHTPKRAEVPSTTMKAFLGFDKTETVCQTVLLCNAL